MNLKLLLKIILIMSLTLGLFVGCKTTDDSDTSSSSDQSAETLTVRLSNTDLSLITQTNSLKITLIICNR